MYAVQISNIFLFLTVLVLLITVSIYLYGGAQQSLPQRSFGDVKIYKNLQVNGITTTRVESVDVLLNTNEDITFSKSIQRYFNVSGRTTQVNIPSIETIVSLFPYNSKFVNDDGRQTHTPMINFGRIINGNVSGGQNIYIFIEDYASVLDSGNTPSITVYGSTVSVNKRILLTPGNYVELNFKRSGDYLSWFTS